MKRISYLLACVLLWGCHAEIEDPIPEIEPVPITFAPQMALTTRATDTAFEYNDAIGVYIGKQEGGNKAVFKSSGNYADNHKYIYSGSSFISGTTLYYPNDNSLIDVYAYYPWVNTSSASAIKFEVKTDQSTGNNYTLSDFMMARQFNCANSFTTIPLSFSHVMAKLVFHIDQTTMPSGTPTITCTNLRNSVVMNFVDFTYNTSNSSKVNITPCRIDSKTYKVVIPPQELAKGTEFIKVVLGGDTYIYRSAEAIVWDSGLEYNYLLYRE